jgi:hypothetical protein
VPRHILDELIAQEASCLLAALSVQIEYGDHNPDKHTAGFLRNELIKYIPRHLYSLQKPEVWEKDFVTTHMKSKSFTEMMFFPKNSFIY